MIYSESQRMQFRQFSVSMLLGMMLFAPFALLAVEQAALPQSGVVETQSTVSQAQSSVPQTQTIDVMVPQSGIPATELADQFDGIQAPRNYLSGKVTSFASYMDRFFGGDRHYQESNPSVLQVDLSRATGYGGGRQFDLAARLNFRLPVTEGKLRLLIETDPEKNAMDVPTKTLPVLPSKSAAPKGVGVAARFASADEGTWHFHTDAGLKFPIPIRPFVRSAVNYSLPLGEWRMTAAESVYWFNTLGVGETTSLNFERIINAQFLFRSSSNVTWLRNQQNLDMRQDWSFFHTLDDRTALLYQLATFGISNPGNQVTDTVLLFDYRYRLHQKWMYFDFSPQLHFPKLRNYQATRSFSVRLEVLFDDAR
jgi:hypothetical protein